MGMGDAKAGSYHLRPLRSLQSPDGKNLLGGQLRRASLFPTGNQSRSFGVVRVPLRSHPLKVAQDVVRLDGILVVALVTIRRRETKEREGDQAVNPVLIASLTT
jgi:hypothetical protein